MTQKRLLFFLGVLLLIGLSTYFLIKLAKGYKFDLSQRTLRPTGLLVATSIPDGAQVMVNGKLTSATNTTIYLSPDSYEIEIKKEGFHSWKKTLRIEKELVTKTDAWLFPQVPDFRALTFAGAGNPLLSPDGSKVVYQVLGTTPEKSGLWVLDLSDLPFGLSREPKQIVRSVLPAQDFAKASYRWSPDSRQILVSLQQAQGKGNFLVDPNNLNPATSLVDISENLPQLKIQWQQEENLKQEQKLAKLPGELAKIIKEKTNQTLFSPDETKILYTATAAAVIPEKLIPPLPGASSQTQERNLKPDRTYIYDIKEDRNYRILETNCLIDNFPFPRPTPTPQLPSCLLKWLPNSKHLILAEKDQVTLMEFEGTNKIAVYKGAYQFPFAFITPAANKLVILTTLMGTSDSLPNLYAINLR